MKFKTQQEEFWANEFGDEYNVRNADKEKHMRSRTHFFEKFPPVASVYEPGASTGMNLEAMHALNGAAEFYATEINENAFQELTKKPYVQAQMGSVLHNPPYKAQLVLTYGLLIAINPDYLKDAYYHLYRSSEQYILICEYYNPVPAEIPYHGKKNMLWKRDFAGDMMDEYDMKLLDYGFVYHRDPYPMGDITWFLLEK